MIELTVSFVLKFLHLVALMMGAGAGFGAMAVARQARRAGGAPSPQLMAMRPFFARLGLIGVTLIWITGLGLWLMRYDFVDLGGAYSLKLVASLILLGVVIALHRLNRRIAAGAPAPTWLPKLAMAPPLLTLIAVALAVWVFL